MTNHDFTFKIFFYYTVSHAYCELSANHTCIVVKEAADFTKNILKKFREISTISLLFSSREKRSAFYGAFCGR
ncbi:uncharacterized protein PHALS_02307 [Plasmopara halstedii]|uniref:Uncharacterized protein n=1 Tax=Plasmopara halstedii TaxID=4781 RepID=A0A0P1AUE0_PLAHL|nr:uncharacterized protein PHALS_02307 [Plasmopara halstedii]CEG45977.1 hypothetical protein PHALS_02307 [Plasmopara halstedii]|eukprot:XP_024582346.1 hypothetical protein PHALS_02307 [Plasmopara halstedii]